MIVAVALAPLAGDAEEEAGVEKSVVLVLLVQKAVSTAEKHPQCGLYLTEYRYQEPLVVSRL